MKGNEFKRIIKSGRTHLKDAVPITLGQEFHAHSTALEKNIKLLKSSQNDLLNLNLGSNAIGTGINTQKGYKKKIVTNLKKITKIPWKIPKDPIYESQYVSSFVEVSNNLSLLTIDLTKIANDLRLLDSGPTTGLHEIILPPVQPGSSIMPGKVNPSIPEMLNMVCYQVMGNTEAIKMAGQAGQLELNVMTPLIAKDLIESLDILNNSLIQFDNKCIKGIKANKETCKRYFEYSQGLATLLNPIIGYEKAAQVVKESTRTGKPITEIILKKGILTKKELSKMLDVSKITKKN
jgi:aspartate ammonia-lyase